MVFAIHITGPVNDAARTAGTLNFHKTDQSLEQTPEVSGIPTRRSSRRRVNQFNAQLSARFETSADNAPGKPHSGVRTSVVEKPTRPATRLTRATVLKASKPARAP